MTLVSDTPETGMTVVLPEVHTTDEEVREGTTNVEAMETAGHPIGAEARAAATMALLRDTRAPTLEVDTAPDATISSMTSATSTSPNKNWYILRRTSTLSTT